MADATFHTLVRGTPVAWTYRSGEGHGYVRDVARMGTTAANTLYNLRQVDHHVGEPEIVQHTGADIRVSTRAAVEVAEAKAKTQGR